MQNQRYWLFWSAWGWSYTNSNTSNTVRFNFAACTDSNKIKFRTEISDCHSLPSFFSAYKITDADDLEYFWHKLNLLWIASRAVHPNYISCKDSYEFTWIIAEPKRINVVPFIDFLWPKHTCFTNNLLGQNLCHKATDGKFNFFNYYKRNNV